MICEKIKSELAHVKEEKERVKRLIEKAPPGKLQYRKNGNYFKYYQIFDDGTQKYIPKDQKILKEQLAEKEYQKSKFCELEIEEKAAQTYLKIIESSKTKSDHILDSPAFKAILQKHSDDMIIQEWLAHPPKKNEAFPQFLTIPTSEGSLVRSKSEAIISEAMYRKRLPFFYDCVLHLDTIDVYPDFMIMHPKTHDIYLWEHLGMLDKESYLNRNLSKLKDYIRNGIVPSDRLILTFETEAVPLSPVYVEELIDYYFM